MYKITSMNLKLCLRIMLFNNWSHLSLKPIDWKLIILSRIEANYTLYKKCLRKTHTHLYIAKWRTIKIYIASNIVITRSACNLYFLQGLSGAIKLMFKWLMMISKMNHWIYDTWWIWYKDWTLLKTLFDIVKCEFWIYCL